MANNKTIRIAGFDAGVETMKKWIIRQQKQHERLAWLAEVALYSAVNTARPPCTARMDKVSPSHKRKRVGWVSRSFTGDGFSLSLFNKIHTASLLVAQ